MPVHTFPTKRLLSGDCENKCGSYDLPIDSQEGNLRLACAPQTNDSLSSANTTTTRNQHDSLWKLLVQCVLKLYTPRNSVLQDSGLLYTWWINRSLSTPMLWQGYTLAVLLYLCNAALLYKVTHKNLLINWSLLQYKIFLLNSHLAVHFVIQYIAVFT